MMAAETYRRLQIHDDRAGLFAGRRRDRDFTPYCELLWRHITRFSIAEKVAHKAVGAFEALQGDPGNCCYYSIHSLDADAVSWRLFNVLPDLSVLVDNKGWGGC